MFAEWATNTKTFLRIIESTPESNAYERLLPFDQDKGCILGDAIDVAQMLSDSLRRDSRVDIIVGKVEAVSKDRNRWGFAGQGIKTERVVLARAHTRGLTTWQNITLISRHSIWTCA